MRLMFFAAVSASVPTLEPPLWWGKTKKWSKRRGAAFIFFVSNDEKNGRSLTEEVLESSSVFRLGGM